MPVPTARTPTCVSLLNLLVAHAPSLPPPLCHQQAVTALVQSMYGMELSDLWSDFDKIMVGGGWRKCCSVIE